MGMGFQFEQHSLGLWDLSWDLKKITSWEMGLGPPLHDPHLNLTFWVVAYRRFDCSMILEKKKLF